jgi:23S rRNA pseudouridine1911/1915/1917 synthase
MLTQGRVSVGGSPCKIASRQIHPGETIEIGPRRTVISLPKGLELLYEDGDIVIVQKPSGLLTVATLDEKDRTVYAYLRQYLKAYNPKNKLFIVHRLDKFASGILVFAKSERVQEILQGIFSRHKIERKYWAIVEGRVPKNHGTIESCLAEDKSFRMHSTQDTQKGKKAITHYRVLKRGPNLTVLEVTLETGRKNQIRAHLSEMGHPIVGDRGYGSSQDPLKRLGLHAYLLGFKHPVSGETLEFRTAPPAEFIRYLPSEVICSANSE